MSCRAVQRALSAWIDGDLKPSGAAEVAAHVEGCPRCAAVARDLREIRSVAGDLPEHAVPPALFRRVVAAAATRPDEVPATRRWGWALALPGLAVAGLAVAIVLPSLLPRDTARTSPRPATRVAAALPRARSQVSHGGDEALLRAASAEFRRAEKHYRSAIAKLRVIARRESQRWRSPRRRRYHQALSDLDASVARCRRAAHLSPADPALQELLFASYRNEIRYLQGAILGAVAGDGLPSVESPRPLRFEETL